MYADDTLILAVNNEDAEIYMQCIQQAGRMFGLQLNWNTLDVLPVRCEARIKKPNGDYVVSEESLLYLGSFLCDFLTFLTLRLHVRRQPSLGRRQCETKTSASGAKLYKIITQLHPQRRILCKVRPLAPLSKTRVCHKLASPIMAWVPPSSCTSRIPK